MLFLENNVKIFEGLAGELTMFRKGHVIKANHLMIMGFVVEGIDYMVQITKF